MAAAEGQRLPLSACADPLRGQWAAVPEAGGPCARGSEKVASRTVQAGLSTAGEAVTNSVKFFSSSVSVSSCIVDGKLNRVNNSRRLEPTVQ